MSAVATVPAEPPPAAAGEVPSTRVRPTGSRAVVLAALTVAVIAMVGGTFGVRTVCDEVMSPALEGGDVVAVNRLTYRARLPFRGDIVAFHEQASPRVARVIGIGGDVVEIRRGRVTIGGVAVDEPYRAATAPDVTKRGGPWCVPGGMVLVMDDRSDDGADGRQSRLVPIAALEGRIAFVLSPFGRRGQR